MKTKAGGRPARRAAWIVSGPEFAWDPAVEQWRSAGTRRFRLGVPLGEHGAARYSDDELAAERFEFSVRMHRYLRELLTTATTPMEEDRAALEAERCALADMRRLQRHGGEWLTDPQRKGGSATRGRPQQSPALVHDWRALQRRYPNLTVRSGAAILAARSGQRPRAIEDRLRRALRK